jgi:DHA1 family multidrug resistance protein-like MFS transporter
VAQSFSYAVQRLGSALGLTNRDLGLIFSCNLVGSFGDGLFAYLLPLYMTKTLGADSVQVGILYAVMSLFAASTLFLAGMLADRYDRKKIMIAGWVAWLPAPLIFAFAQNWLQMVPGMIMWGFWLGGPTSTAYIIARADRSRLTLTFTTISAAWSLGYIFSPATGGYLAEAIGMRSVFFLASFFYAVACMFLVFIRSQHATDRAMHSNKEQRSFFKLLRTRKLLKLSVFFASIIFILMMFRPFVPQFLADEYGYHGVEIGVLGSVAFASSAVLGILLGKLGDRRRRTDAVIVSMFFCAAALALFLLFDQFSVLVIAFLLFGGSYVMWSLMSAVVGPLAPEDCSARWISVPQTLGMFSSIIAPYVGGVLYAASRAYPFMVAVVAVLVLALIALTKILE